MNRSEELHSHATECGQMANFLRTKENRAAWNDIAERYLRCAQWYDTRRSMADGLKDARRQKGPRIRSDAIVGADRRGARDVAASLAHRIDTTQDHIVDEHWIQSVALFQRAECLGGEIERGDLMPG
jgi:hypothetical protein